ncbi:hypothetical protein AYK26_03175 [Euryarchaeota archaeon SM23-78]|nr:MAG: hypothetical protein AYK26_03175 [Euryarchaeota archaeon SM23-78]MBW3000698.1 hypothetical protein [Candidatus Woesearchaeota archaeon]
MGDEVNLDVVAEELFQYVKEHKILKESDIFKIYWAKHDDGLTGPQLRVFLNELVIQEKLIDLYPRNESPDSAPSGRRYYIIAPQKE